MPRWPLHARPTSGHSSSRSSTRTDALVAAELAQLLKPDVYEAVRAGLSRLIDEAALATGTRRIR